MLLGGLAIHLDYLIMDAAARTDRLGALARSRSLVDAKDDNACAFYEAHEFILLIAETRRPIPEWRFPRSPCRRSVGAHSLMQDQLVEGGAMEINLTGRTARSPVLASKLRILDL
jgi:hypothetical protein